MQAETTARLLLGKLKRMFNATNENTQTQREHKKTRNRHFSCAENGTIRMGWRISAKMSEEKHLHGPGAFRRYGISEGRGENDPKGPHLECSYCGSSRSFAWIPA
jgi:hypothetical protein